MLRPILVIVAAITLTRPEMDLGEARRFAKVLQHEAKEHGFDPLSGVSIIHFESGWQPDARSKNGEDYGLGQIRARFIGACKKDKDPLNDPSDECRAEKQRLLDGEENIREMARIISLNRGLCKKKTGSAWFHQWLASYQGLNFPKENKWCQAKSKTWRVVKYRRSIVKELLAGGKLKKKHQERLAALEAKQAQERKEAEQRRAQAEKKPAQP